MNETIFEKLNKGYYLADDNPLKAIFQILSDLEDNEITSYQMELALRNQVANLFEKDTLTLGELVDYLNKLDKEYLLKIQSFLPKDSTFDDISFILKSINTILNGEEITITEDINPDYEISLGTLLTYLYNERRFNAEEEPHHVFLDAIKNDDLHMFQAFISNDEVDINARNYYNDTLLHFAARENALKIIDALIKMGLNFNSRNDINLTPVFVAYLSQKYDAVKFLIDRGADLGVLNDDNLTITEAAIINNDLEIFQYIIEKRGFGISNGITCDPYGLAIKYQANQVFHYLCEINYPVKIKIENHFLLACNCGNQEVIDYFLNKGFSVNLEFQGSTPLFVAVLGEQIEGVKNLLSKGANPNPKGYSPLIPAIKSGNKEMIELLIEHGARTIEKGRERYSPIMYAIFYRQFEIMKLLIEKGEDVNYIGHKGVTALYFACDTGEVDYVKCLLENGAKPLDNALNPLRLALISGNTEIIELLLSNGFVLKKDTLISYDLNTMFFSAKKKRSKVLETLVNLDIKDKNGVGVPEYILQKVKKHQTLTTVLTSIVYLFVVFFFVLLSVVNYVRFNYYSKDVTRTSGIITQVDEDKNKVYYQFEIDGEMIESSSNVSDDMIDEFHIDDEVEIIYKNNNYTKNILTREHEQYKKEANLGFYVSIFFICIGAIIFRQLYSNRRYLNSLRIKSI